MVFNLSHLFDPVSSWILVINDPGRQEVLPRTGLWGAEQQPKKRRQRAKRQSQGTRKVQHGREKHGDSEKGEN